MTKSEIEEELSSRLREMAEHYVVPNTLPPITNPHSPPSLPNLTCDICGYTHPEPNLFVVSLCADGIVRCSICSGKVYRRYKGRV